MEEQTEIPGLYRDRNSGAIINRDNSALSAYKMRRDRASQESKRLDSIESRVDDLAESLADIKKLLSALVINQSIKVDEN